MVEGEGRVALVTGANRGIGREICRQLAQAGLRVALTARREEAGRDATEALAAEGGDVRFHLLDVTDPDQAEAAVRFCREEMGGLDVLVNNAGVYLDRGVKAEDVDPELLRRSMEVNVIGPLRLCQAALPAMRESGYGRIVNVSSGMGCLTGMGTGSLAYRTSKTALNAVTRVLAAENEDAGILINAVCPGWVRTDMGGSSAPRSVEQGADTAVWLATLPGDGPTGGFFRDRKPIDW